MAEARYATPRTPERKTLGAAAARIARVLRQPLLPWQRQVVDVALEVDDAGRLVYRDVSLTVPRQQGKTWLVLVLILTRALVEPRSNVIYAAQSALDAKKKFDGDWVPAIEGSLLADQVTVRRAPGREGLLFANGSRQSIAASTQKAGHGETIDLAIVDEAFAYKDARLEQALKPAQMTRSSAQFWIVSTAGTPTQSPYLHEKVQTGRQAVEAGVTEGLCYLEWSAPDGAEASDPETWRACMPALGYTVGEDVVRASQLSMSRSEFARAFLNRWVTSMGDPIVALDEWNALADASAPRPDWVVFGLDVAPRNTSAAIVAVGERGDDLQASVLEHGEGTEWLLPALERRVAEFDRPYVVVDQKATAHLLPEIRAAAGFDRVITLGAGEVPAACEFWLRLVNEGRLRHRGEAELAIALDGAGQRSLGDGWAWSRSRSGVDITPLTAVTFAVEFWRGSWGTREERAA